MFWGLVASFWVGNIIFVLLTLPLISVWVRILSIPQHILYPTIVFLICVGVYSVNNNMFDVMVAIVFGIVGFLMATFNYPVAPVLLGYILGPLVEENFRRTLFISNGNFSAFFRSPVSVGALLLTAIALLLPPLLRLARGTAKGTSP